MSDDLQQRLQAIQDGFLSSREVIKSQDFLIEQLRTQLATVTAERDEVREKLEQIADSRNHTKLIMEDALGRSQHLEKLLAGAERELAAARERVEKLKKQQDALISTIARDKKFWDEDKERLEKLEKVKRLADNEMIDWNEDRCDPDDYNILMQFREDLRKAIRDCEEKETP